MEKFHKGYFKALAGHDGENCISIYIPTHRYGMDVNEDLDLTAFKASLQRVKKALKTNGLPLEDIKRIMKPAKELLKDNLFWKNQLEGLAVFMGDGVFKAFNLPYTVEQFELVSHEFYLAPLIPLYTDNTDFYLLALSKNGISLFNASRYDITEIDVRGMIPANLHEVVWMDEHQKESQTRTGGTVGSAGLYFTNDHADQLRKDEVRRYVLAIDEGLQQILAGDNKPLVIAAVDYVFGYFKKHSSYQNIVETAVPGNPDRTSIEELHDQAWLLMSQYFNNKTFDAEKVYEDLSATAKSSSDINEIVPAAIYSKVDKLFLQNGSHIWGHYDLKNNRVVMHRKYEQGDDDLLNKAAINTILNGGDVYLVDKYGMPYNSYNVAAVFRYSGGGNLSS